MRDAAYRAREAWLTPPEPSREQIEQERRDALVLRRLPDALCAARALYGDDAYLAAAWVRFVWAARGDAFDAAVADAAAERFRASFSLAERDCWDDCIESGTVRDLAGAIAWRHIYLAADAADTQPKERAA